MDKQYRRDAEGYVDEPLYDKDGTLLDDAEVERIVEEVRQAVGRPSLSAPGETSPQVTVRLPAALDAALAARAKQEGKTRSELIREAVAAFLD